jgi:ADP-ribose pyrophosphatase YjhB (NUDIX family)
MSEHPIGRRERRIPEGDSHERLVCIDCGHVQYDNPKIVVGSVVVHEGRFLMCKRAIEPRSGFWTLPAGFLENGETPEEGALREAREEANAELEIEGLLAIYTVRHISQVQIFFRARLAKPDFSPGPESTDVRLYDWDAIPRADLAFPSVHWALDHHRAMTEGRAAPPFGRST